jgi:hypothetical protein
VENQIQNNQDGEMTLGDALALSKSEPSDNDEMTLDQAMGNSAPTDTFLPAVPEEHKVGFIKGMAMRFDAGIKNTSAGMFDMAALLTSASPADWAFGGAISKKIKGVAKWERGLAEEQKQESASKNKGVQLAGEFVESAANLGYTLPVDILTGGQTKLALTGKVLPKVEAILSRIPDFALGQGWRSMIEGTQKEGNVLERTAAGVMGAGEGIAMGTVYGNAGSGVKAIPIMTSLGWGSAFYEALKENRLPTKDEQISGVANGTAYGVAFALLPHLKKATKISPEKTALGKYEKLINEHANNGDFEKVKATVDTMMADKAIRPEVKEAISKVLEQPPIKAEPPVSGTITPKGAKGGGKIYHGTGKPIEKLSDTSYSTLNYYGQGFYTTDNLSIAEGYSKKGGKTPSIYEVNPTKDVPLFDMEAPLTKEVKGGISEALGDYSDTLGSSKNLREVFDSVRDLATQDMLPADEVQGIYDSVRANLEDMGYRGLKHTGGLKTGKAPHEVKIYWNPESDVKLSTPTGEGKVAEVPGGGETKVRGLAAGVEEKAIENKLVKNLGDLGDLPKYAVDNMAEQSRKAVELLNKDYDMAKRIAMGEELPPNDILPESVFIAVENRAIKEGDVATIKSLGVSSELVKEATMMGKRLRVLAERDPESPVTAINEVVKARQESAQKRLKTKDVKKLVEKDVSDIRKEMKKTSATKETWTDFIKSLEC